MDEDKKRSPSWQSVHMGSVCNARIMYEPNAAGNASAFTANAMRRTARRAGFSISERIAGKSALHDGNIKAVF